MVRLFLLWAIAASTFAIDPAGLAEHAHRRAALRKALPDAIVALAGDAEPDRGGLRAGFFQESNFFYLTGWREPGAMLILTPDAEYFFLPARNQVRERYTGPKIGPEDAGAAQASGFPNIAGAKAFPEKLRELARGRTVYALTKHPSADKVRQALDGQTLQDAALPIARLRMVKSARELSLIQAATDASIAAHRAAWSRIAAGVHEYQLAAAFLHTMLDRGCERPAYAPIVGAGPNAIILHYSANRRRMDAGELLLIDAGAECSAYAADLTRTLPVNGKFTPRQREIYEIVLGAQKAAIAAARPGMKLTGHGEGTLNQIALDYVNRHGKDRNGEKLGKYYLHQLGHHVGLDVHDPADPDMTLQPGMVVTIEPGLYIPEENIGVRIEDMVLITENGVRVLSTALPREPGAVEKAIRR